MEMLPRESAEFILSKAEQITIDMNAIDDLVKKLSKVVQLEEYDLKKWKSDNPLHPQTMTNESVDWIFLMDSLNFSFWPNKDEEFSIESEVGYWALCAAIRRAKRENIPITDPNYYGRLSLEQARHIFRTDNQVIIPMLEERVSILKENSAILNEHFKGSFVNCILQCNESALKLLEMLYEYFPSFRDEAIFKDRKVTFLKRAQILIADIWGCFEGKGLGHFTDIDKLTTFADYRIPQVLHYFGILKYSNILEDQLKKNNLLENGHPYEVEIRGASIQAIELIKEKLKNFTKSDKTLSNSIQIDFYLWRYRRVNSDVIDQKSPFHRVRSIYY